MSWEAKTAGKREPVTAKGRPVTKLPMSQSTEDPISGIEPHPVKLDCTRYLVKYSIIRPGKQNEVKDLNLFEHLIVLHVFLGSFVGAFSLSLQSNTGAEGHGQLVNQSDDSPHDTARKEHQYKINITRQAASGRCHTCKITYSHKKSEKPEM